MNQSPFLFSRVREQNRESFDSSRQQISIESTPRKESLASIFSAYVTESKLHSSGIVVLSIRLSVLP